MKQFGLSSAERIKSKKEFDLIYSSGEILFSSNKKFKAVFNFEKETEQAVIKAAFAVSSKAGIAVWRNRVKRLMRDSYRTNKSILYSIVEKKNFRLMVIFSPVHLNERKNKKLVLNDVLPDIVDLMNQIQTRI